MRRSLSSLFLVCGFLLALPAVASAQQRPGTQQPDSASAMQSGEQREAMQAMEEQMRAMMPMMMASLRAVTHGTMAALAEPDAARNLARFVRNYHQALVAEGFSRDEAMRIVASVGLPTIPGGQ